MEFHLNKNVRGWGLSGEVQEIMPTQHDLSGLQSTGIVLKKWWHLWQINSSHSLTPWLKACTPGLLCYHWFIWSNSQQWAWAPFCPMVPLNPKSTILNVWIITEPTRSDYSGGTRRVVRGAVLGPSCYSPDNTYCPFMTYKAAAVLPFLL